MKIIRVGLDVPLDRLFDYRCDDADARVGDRVLVPFGRRTMVGVILEVAGRSDVSQARLKTALRVLREAPGLTEEDLWLPRFAAEYYHYPLGSVAVNALPGKLRRAPSARKPRTVAAQATSPGLPSESRPALTVEQVAAVDAICARLDGFHPHLLMGVTGSGKTEVYLRVMEPIIARNRQVLLLVPEIGLTPQLENTVAGRFPDVPMVSLHSGLPGPERCRRWLSAQSGTARIVLGTRVAIFTPLHALGLIVVDEEHDSSYKQMEGLRYSARDLAVVLARARGIPVILGSATPALETYHNAKTGRYSALALRHRVNARPPRVRCVSVRCEQLSQGLSAELLAAVAERLAHREQSLIFINRRGYSPVLMCRACGWLSDCHRCSAQLVYHAADQRMHCHHCGHRSPTPPACPACGNADLTPVGQGTQRVTASLQEAFPAARIARIDRDTTRNRASWQSVRDALAARAVDILVGTQMLAKGHDFPHLNLVGVLNADSSLYSTDFRAPERLYAMLTQVAGRAGRGAGQGEVLIQTDFPEHPIYAALRDQDYASFADALLEERRGAGLPPFVYQVLLRAEAPRLAAVMKYLEDAAQAAQALGRRVIVYDPVPASMVRIAGRERGQLLVQSRSRVELKAFLDEWRKALATHSATRARWSLDVDPLEL